MFHQEGLMTSTGPLKYIKESNKNVIYLLSGCAVSERTKLKVVLKSYPSGMTW